MATIEYEGNIGVVGFSGSGKSTLGDALREELGWSKPVIDVGQYFRDALDWSGLSIQEGDSVPLRLDRTIDRKTVRVLQHENHRIFVGRTVTHLARKKDQGPLRYYGVGVRCNFSTIVERARMGWNRKKHLPEETRLPSFEYVAEKISLRNEQDLKRYAELYSVTSEDELYGVPPNNMEVWSDRMTIYEEVREVMQGLRGLMAITQTFC